VDRLKKRSSDGLEEGLGLKSIFSYENRADKYQSQSNQKGYRFGAALRTVYDYPNGIYGHVQLPTKVGSSCVFSPVRFLKNSESICTLRITPEKCAGGRRTKMDYQVS